MYYILLYYIVRSGRLHCLRALPPPSPPRAKKPADVSPFSPEQILIKSAQRQENPCCDILPKKWKPRSGILGIMRHSWATSCRGEAPPKSYVTRLTAIQPSKHFINCSRGFLALELEPTCWLVINKLQNLP